MLYIELLGRLRVSWGTHRQRIDLKRQSIGLLAHFALSRTHRTARETLIERFWPEAEPEKGRIALSSALFRLRQALRPLDADIITLDSTGDVGISDRAELWLDVNALQSAVRPACATRGRLSVDGAAALEAGLALYGGELMDGFFEDWVLAEREEVRALYVRGKLRLLDHHVAGGEIDAALECGREVLRLDPLRESVHRKMMDLFMDNGERAVAREVYKRLVRVLQQELGVAPSPETTALFRTL